MKTLAPKKKSKYTLMSFKFFCHICFYQKLLKNMTLPQ